MFQEGVINQQSNRRTEFRRKQHESLLLLPTHTGEHLQIGTGPRRNAALVRSCEIASEPKASRVSRGKGQGSNGVSRKLQGSIDRLSQPKYVSEKRQSGSNRAWRPSGGGIVVMTDGFPQQQQFFTPYVPLLSESASSHSRSPSLPSQFDHSSSQPPKTESDRKQGRSHSEPSRSSSTDTDDMAWRLLYDPELMERVLIAARRADIGALIEMVDGAKQCPLLGAMNENEGWFDTNIPRWFLLWLKRRQERAMDDGFSFDFELPTERTAGMDPWRKFSTRVDPQLSLLEKILFFEQARELVKQKSDVRLAEKILSEVTLRGYDEEVVEKRRQYLVEEQELEEDLPDIHKQQHAHLMELMVTATEIDGPKWLESELELDSVATSQPEELPSSLAGRHRTTSVGS